MPFTPKFSSDDIVDAAFEIAGESGFDAVTARSVAKAIGGSVAPIYYHFESVEALVKAVVQKLFALTRDALAEQDGVSPFEAMGLAGFEFARRYPVFVRELVLKPNPYIAAYQAEEEALLRMLDGDPKAKALNMEERRSLLVKVKALQIGFQTLIANGQLPAWLGEDEARKMFLATGNALLDLELAMRAT